MRLALILDVQVGRLSYTLVPRPELTLPHWSPPWRRQVQARPFLTHDARPPNLRHRLPPKAARLSLVVLLKASD
jgi:hypothetical protein